MGYFTNYPFHVFLILANELCERFSYYGMKAVLVFFLWKALQKTEAQATALYHTFVVLCYLTPLLGAMIADGWLGKYKTILYVSVIYACGNILMTVSAIPFNGVFRDWICYLALIIIAFGTGGIKPCVSSFGGDQFKEDQVRQKDSFFSLFYLTINIGSMFSTLLIPFIRGEVKCFEGECYALCFGIPAILMMISIVLFIIGTKWYVKNPPGSSILQKFFGCIGTALGRKCSCSKPPHMEKKDHWIDYAAPDYEQAFIEDVKDVLRVAWLFIPLPVFWALFDQMGSKWAFQAQQMNGAFENLTVFPDMMHFMNPLLVVVVVPFLEYVVYPCLDKVHIPNRPLQRMTLGMFLAGTAFLLTSFLQIAIETDKPQPLNDGQSKFQFINSAPDHTNVSYLSADGNWKHLSILPLQSGGEYEYLASGMYHFEILSDDGNATNCSVSFEDKKIYQVFITADYSCITHEQFLREQTMKGESTSRVYNGLNHSTSVLLRATFGQGNQETVFEYSYSNISPDNVSKPESLIFADFDVKYDSEGKMVELDTKVKSRNGAVDLLLLARNKDGKVVLKQINEIKAWTKNIFLQTPQFVVMSFGECLFSVTGLSFAYTQAPPSMKSILTSIWLLTVCFGNIIIIIVQGASGRITQTTEFFIFTGLMYVTTVIFAIMSCMYVYVTPRDTPAVEVKRDEHPGYDNMAASVDDLHIGSASKVDDLRNGSATKVDDTESF